MTVVLALVMATGLVSSPLARHQLCSAGLPVASFHAYKEFGAKNRPEGYNVALRLAVAF